MEGLQPVLPIGGANNCEGGWGNWGGSLIGGAAAAKRTGTSSGRAATPGLPSMRKAKPPAPSSPRSTVSVCCAK